MREQLLSRRAERVVGRRQVECGLYFILIIFTTIYCPFRCFSISSINSPGLMLLATIVPSRPIR